MDKVIELAIEADSATGFPIACIESQKIKPFLERFYTLARADLEAENAKLKEALHYIRGDVRIHGDLRNPSDIARAALGETK